MVKNKSREILDKHWNDGNAALLCTYPNLVKCYEEVWQEAQKELLEEIKQDYKEGNPDEDIVAKYLERLDKLED